MADILFILDKSGSIRHERFERVKTMITDVIDSLEIFNDKVRVAAVCFSNDATLEFDLDQYRTKQDIMVRNSRTWYQK